MREIKFRAWDGENERMIEVHAIDFVEEQINYGYALTPDPYNSAKSFDGVVLMQYTGLKDKNNQPIYEGDVLSVTSVLDPEANPFLREVVWNDQIPYLGWMLYETGEVKEAFARIMKDIDCKWKVEVIGNIYENPELIEV